MLPILLLAAVASLIFIVDEKTGEQTQSGVVQEQTPNKKTFKNLVKDLMDHHGITQSEWKNNLRINKYLDGITIGSDEGFVHLSDAKPIKLYLGKNKIKLNTWNVNEAIEKMKHFLESDIYSQSDKKTIESILNDLVKYQDYYYLKKYLKYKKLYNGLKTNTKSH
jgi:hypothetical protein